jgi:hypothetical protein
VATEYSEEIGTMNNQDTRERLQAILALIDDHEDAKRQIWALFKDMKKPAVKTETVHVKDDAKEKQQAEEIHRLTEQLQKSYLQVEQLQSKVEKLERYKVIRAPDPEVLRETCHHLAKALTEVKPLTPERWEESLRIASDPQQEMLLWQMIGCIYNCLIPKHYLDLEQRDSLLGAIRTVVNEDAMRLLKEPGRTLTGSDIKRVIDLCMVELERRGVLRRLAKDAEWRRLNEDAKKN